MKNKIDEKYLLMLLVSLIFLSCNQHKEIPVRGDQSVQVFNAEPVRFAPDENCDGLTPDSDGLVCFANGRIILKKVTLPVYERQVNVKAKIILSSAGDRWDKSGSCFIIPAGSENNLLKILRGDASFPETGDELEGMAGIVPGAGYQPSIELMRFMTPFGVGHYNDQMELRRPPYIPEWAENVVWEQDVTDLLSELEQDVWIGFWIDTWTPEGYMVSLELNFDETEGPCYAKTETKLLPLVNTVYYTGPQTYPDIFARKDVVVTAKVPDNATNVRLKYITTGHGGHSGGDEFVNKENIIYVDGQKAFSFVPWRDDCASFRRFNPATGTWFAEERDGEYLDWNERKYKTATMHERVSSSDFSRSNWCPGSCIIPIEIALPDLKPGQHEFRFSIPKAQEIDGDKLNHWLISAYLVWDI